jgi:subtilisin family serine protease
VTGEPDVHGHGTHVIGIITAAANTGQGAAGLAYNTRVASYRACGSDGKCAESDELNSIQAALNLRPAPVAINVSLGGREYSRALCDAVSDALNAGITVVVAAGNDAVDGVSSWAACSGVVLVSATDSNDQPASFSNRSLTVAEFMVAAPGVGVWSTLPMARYGTFSGTSQATPHVTALVALMKGLVPSLTPSQIRLLLVQNTDKVGGNYGGGPTSWPCLCISASTCAVTAAARVAGSSDRA